MVQILVFVGLTFLVVASAHESYLPNSRHPDVQDKCFIKETGDFIEFDKSLKPIGKCVRYTCRDDFVVQVNECSRYMQPDNCEILPRDLKQPFPDCCPKLSCIDNDGNIEIRNTSA
ncbi:unnamed protein product [Hermetia illucens]|uniref:Single domain-containing protein n=1 Tax=Hermetia illucens TaxID=343691 RepID=A0A7R8YTC5_HERIL|nr:uncharacterized protein LOC119650578 [Hermetia illucens]CAD7084847.1 unnamed protein product [Hermetia illucens]